MTAGRLVSRLLFALFLIFQYALCGCDYRPTEEVGTLATGIAFGVMGTLLCGVVFGDRKS